MSLTQKVFGKALRHMSCSPPTNISISEMHRLTSNLLTPTSNQMGLTNCILSQKMASLARMHREGVKRLKMESGAKLLGGAPQLRGIVLRVLIKKPKKPNSANRKCVLVKLSNGREGFAYVPGEGHNLQEHSIVLVEGGRLQDVPGVKLQCVRGAFDLGHVKKKT